MLRASAVGPHTLTTTAYRLLFTHTLRLRGLARVKRNSKKRYCCICIVWLILLFCSVNIVFMLPHIADNYNSRNILLLVTAMFEYLNLFTWTWDIFLNSGAILQFAPEVSSSSFKQNNFVAVFWLKLTDFSSILNRNDGILFSYEVNSQSMNR